MATTAEQQLILELINQARTDPAGEFDRLIVDGQGVTDLIDQAIDFFEVDVDVLQQQLLAFDPVAPMAFNGALTTSAQTHNDLMIEFDTQAHNLPGEPGIAGRIRQAGYENFTAATESVFGYAFDELYAHAGLFIDWGDGPSGIQEPAGHRNAMMSDSFTEVGIAWAAENDPNTTLGPFVTTHHYATRSDYEAQLLGVVFDDADNDDFYDIGEGMGGVTITVTAISEAGEGQTYTTTSWASGGYQLVVPDGVYNVVFSGGGLDGAYIEQLVMEGDNVKIDLNAQVSDDTNVDDNDTDPENENDQENSGLILAGGAGQDNLIGSAFDDVLTGFGGGDLLTGRAGDDILSGGGGRDEIRGGDGSDTINGNRGGDRLFGGSGDDEMQGGGGRDRIKGNGGNDDLYGGNGKDNLIGGAGRDDLDGGGKNDRLVGGKGNDDMTGGRGADVFVFSKNSGSDTITDFNANLDVIELTGALARGLTAQQITSSAVETASGSLILDFGDGNSVELLNFTDVAALADAIQF